MGVYIKILVFILSFCVDSFFIIHSFLFNSSLRGYNKTTVIIHSHVNGARIGPCGVSAQTLDNVYCWNEDPSKKISAVGTNWTSYFCMDEAWQDFLL